LKLTGKIAIGSLVSAASLLGLAGCEHETGPALSAELQQVAKSPTRDEPNAQRLCCCRIVGFVQNTSPIEAHVSLRFAVTDVDGNDIATAIDFVPNIPSGGTRPFNASGIFVPCRSVASWEPDVLVIGLYHNDFQGAQ